MNLTDLQPRHIQRILIGTSLVVLGCLAYLMILHPRPMTMTGALGAVAVMMLLWLHVYVHRCWPGFAIRCVTGVALSACMVMAITPMGVTGLFWYLPLTLMNILICRLVIGIVLSALAWVAGIVLTGEWANVDMLVNLVGSGLVTALIAVLASEGLRQRVTRLRIRAERDALTGLLNRGEFDRAVSRAVRQAGESHTALSLALVDLDHFKVLNDELGHVVGDRVLVAFAHFLRARIRRSDRVYRYGGEEFALLLPGAEAQSARAVVEKLLQQLRSTRLYAGVHQTASAGVAEVGPGDSVASFLRRADEALYAAKEGGRDRCHSARECPPESVSGQHPRRGAGRVAG